MVFALVLKTTYQRVLRVKLQARSRITFSLKLKKKMLSGLKKIRDQASGALKTFAEPSLDPEGPTEAGVYKSLLVELQYNQLLISREYQELFKQKEDEIKRLKALAGEPVEADSESSSKKEGQAAKPMKDLSPEDIKTVLKEWDRKMKTNIIQKTEALAEAQIYRESVELLRAQLDAMKDTIKKQTEQIERLERSSKGKGHEQALEHQKAGMEKLVEQFSIMEGEASATREMLKQAELEIVALRTKAESDAETLALLSKNAPGDGAEVQELLKKREEEFTKTVEEMKLEFAARESELQAEITKLTTSLDETRMAMSNFEAAFNDSVAMQATMAAQSRKEAEEQVDAVTLEKDQAVSQLREREGALKEALHNLSRAESDLQRVAQEKEELLSSRSISAQQDLEHKEVALEQARDELRKAQRALEDYKTESQSSLESLKGSLAGKQLEVDEILSRIEDLELEKNALATRGAQSAEEAARLGGELEDAKKQLVDETTKLKSQYELEQVRLQVELDGASTEAKQYKAKNDELETTLAATGSRLAAVDEKLSSARQQLDTVMLEKQRLEEDLSKVNHEVARMTGEMGEMRKQLDETAKRIQEETERVRQQCVEEQEQRLSAQREVHAEELAKARRETAEYRELYTKETTLRRQVHDELMDMKGNIRVFARVRPVLPDERKMAEERQGAGGADVVTEFPAESAGRDLVVKREGAREGSDAKFEFDKVFDPASTQEQVFETVSPLITSVMDGVNVTLFAYGQTGSGKTFTMEGNRESPGVNIRALHRVFDLAAERSTTYTYSFTVSVLEVYLETILDLLGDVESKDAREKLDIRQHPESKAVFVQGLVRRPVTNMKEVEEILQLASKNRTVGAHNMNENSSRSHLVFTLTAVGSSLLKKEKMEGNLNLIDLAGSERIGKTDATGDRLKEAMSINKSLSALGDVINALSLKNGHIPFRNSKLTYLLQDQLQGNAKVGFFANVSPTAFNSSETMCTLNFASRCRKTELGKAKKNVVGGDNVEQLMKDNARLRKQLEELQAGGGTSRLDTSFSSTSGTTPVRTPSKSLMSGTSSSGAKRALEKE